VDNRGAGVSPNPSIPGGRVDGGVAEIFAEQLRRIAAARGRERRGRAIDDLAASVQSNNSVVGFLARLVNTDRHGGRLALEIALRLDLPLPDAVCRLLVPLMSSPRFPAALRLNTASQILRSLDKTSPLVSELLQALTHGTSPRRAVDRLRHLLQRLPGHPAVEALCKELEKQTAIDCPRCGAHLQRPDLVVHLWQAHRLLMEGGRARDPWKMIAGWLGDYAQSGRKELLERSCELGQQLDPLTGLTRVHRLLLAAGLSDEEAKENLSAQAEGRRASLCPHCYALVAQEHEPLPAPINLSRGRIGGNGCTVDVSERYLFTRLFTATSAEILHDGPEPGRRLTRRGQSIFEVGPLVAFAFALAVLLPPRVLPPLTPVSLILMAALGLYLRVRGRHGPVSEPAQRAIDHAWRLLAPRMHRPEFSPDDARFLGRLAITSVGLGSPQLREQAVERLTKLTLPEVVKGSVPSGDLAALRCLEIDDAIRLGRDAVPILSNELALALSTELPFAYGEQLLEAWPSEARDRGERARLRVLLCERAFDLGFEARDLHELGRVSTILGQAYASEDLNGLLRLRWLWNNRPARIWQRNGAASTVFDLARYPTIASQYLEARPDLLLFQPMSVGGNDREASAPILVCEEGVVYRDIVIKDPDISISVKERTDRFELSVGKQKLVFEQEPALLARRLQGWAQFLFHELLPAAASLADRRTPGKLRPLTKQKTLLCPECGNSFLALRGEVGILTEAQAAS
jgi:hypothetical protein